MAGKREYCEPLEAQAEHVALQVASEVIPPRRHGADKRGRPKRRGTTEGGAATRARVRRLSEFAFWAETRGKRQDKISFRSPLPYRSATCSWATPSR
eukprot:scaffold36942_cov50-Phaeocystis_antarctica.AAC.7